MSYRGHIKRARTIGYRRLEEMGKTCLDPSRSSHAESVAKRAATVTRRNRLTDAERAQDTGFDDVEVWREWMRTKREYGNARGDAKDYWRAEHRKWGKFRKRGAEGKPYTQIDTDAEPADHGFDDAEMWREWLRTRREYNRANARGDREAMAFWLAEHRKFYQHRKRGRDGKPYKPRGE